MYVLMYKLEFVCLICNFELHLPGCDCNQAFFTDVQNAEPSRGILYKENWCRFCCTAAMHYANIVVVIVVNSFSFV